MTDPLRSAEDDTGATAPSANRGRPRWVTATFIVVGALILLFVILKVIGPGPGGGGHGPGMHRSAGVTTDLGSHQPPNLEQGQTA